MTPTGTTCARVSLHLHTVDAVIPLPCIAQAAGLWERYPRPGLRSLPEEEAG